MERQRPLQHGFVSIRSGAWYVQYRVDDRDEAGKITRKKVSVRLCPVKDEHGREIGKREAQRIAHTTVLDKVNAQSPTPATLATVQEFWTARFEPEHIANLKKAGRRHYLYVGKKLLPDLGALTLREVTHGHVQTLITGAVKAGLSAQTAQQIKSAVSALFRYAQVCGFHHGDNPAQGVRVPPMKRHRRQPLTFAEAHTLIDCYPAPVKQMVCLSMLTSMNVAEMAGLRREYLNLTDASRMTPEGTIPPHAAMVRENYYEGEFDTTKSTNRNRILPLPPQLLTMLTAYLEAHPSSDPAALVFMNRNGGPVDSHNLANRHLRPKALKAIGRADVGWHLFRHCCATWADWVSMPLSERVAIMGHGCDRMTMHYTHADTDRRRPFMSAIESLIFDSEPAGKKTKAAPPAQEAPPPPPTPTPAAPPPPPHYPGGLENYESATLQ